MVVDWVVNNYKLLHYYYGTKDCPLKKETNLEAYISVNFLQILTKSAPQIMQIFPAFQRDAL